MSADKDFDSLRKTAEKEARMDRTIRQAGMPGEEVTADEIRNEIEVGKKIDEPLKKHFRKSA